ncbi:MAG: c-type cytochrome [Pseudomonadota bacterium]
MNADKLNMVAGSAIGALLVFMLLGFFGGKIFDTRGGHHDHDEPLAFAVEIESGDTEVEVVSIDYAALVASSDTGAGEKLFRGCAACHKVADGANGVGPHLHGLLGRDIASVGGYAYSGVLEGKEGDWGLENLSAFLENPKGWAPGTKMGYAGMRDAEDRVNLIAWLNTQSDAPIELAAAPVETATDAAEETTEGASEDATEEATEEASTEETEPASEETNEATDEAAEASDDAVEEDTTAATETEDAAETSSEEAVTEATEEASEELTVAAADATEEVTEVTEEVSEEATEETEEVAAASTDEAPAAATGGAYSVLLASADPKKGKKVFRKCRACHKLDEGKNSVGPSLYGVINRGIGGVEGFNYSDALANKGGEWNVENLMGFLQAPKSWAPGTKMGFAGLKSEEDRINVITYLNEADGSPEPLE